MIESLIDLVLIQLNIIGTSNVNENMCYVKHETIFRTSDIIAMYVYELLINSYIFINNVYIISDVFLA